MRYEELNDPVEVIVHFGAGTAAPLRFLWRGRAHKVTNVRGRWTSAHGVQKKYHWAVNAVGVGTCQLTLDLERLEWTLKEVVIED